MQPGHGSAAGARSSRLRADRLALDRRVHDGAEDWLEAIQRRDVDAIEIEIRDATVLDQVMVGTVLAKWRVKYLGRIIEDCVLLTDVWVFDEGRWQAVRRHSTPAPAGECAKGS